jgi:hypothetical protein
VVYSVLRRFRHEIAKNTCIFCVCVTLTSLLGCQPPTYIEQVDNAPKICTDISPSARDRLASNASKVQIGDSATSVETLLGIPDTQWPATNKQGDRTVGTEFYYFTRKCGDTKRVFDEDHFVRVGFDLNGRLISISAHGVDGVCRACIE